MERADKPNPTGELTSFQGIIIATWAMAIIAVCLRFLARRLSKAGLWYDDWLIIPATVSISYTITSSTMPLVQKDDSSSHIYQLVATALCFISAIWMVNSTIAEVKLALDMKLDNDELDHFDKNSHLGFFISQICWVVVLWIVKCSILAFYWRLFSCKGRSTRLVIWTIAVAVMCWGIAVCSPIDAFWVKEQFILNGCNGGDPEYDLYRSMGYTIPHIVTDGLLLVFPMPLVWELEMRRSQKVMLTTVFALGGVVTVISGVRLGFFWKIYKHAGYSVANTDIPPFILTNVEINISIICACLPSPGPIITFVFGKFAEMRKRKSTHKRGSKLLEDMVPVIKRAVSPQIISSARNTSWSDGPNPILDSMPIVEAEANPRVRELDAPGPHVLEMEIAEPASEMEALERATELECQRPIAELEGTPRMLPLLQRSV